MVSAPAKPPIKREVVKGDDLNAETTADDRAEMAALGSCLVLQDYLDEVALLVQPSDFREYAHQLVFAAMLEIHNAGKRIDAQLLVNHLKKAKQLDDVGGMPYLLELAAAAPVPSHAAYYAQIVREKAILRGLWLHGESVMADVNKGAGGPDEILAKAELSLMGIEDRRVAESAKPLGDILAAHLLELDKRRDSGGVVSGVRSGFREVEEFIPAFKAGELVIIAARPGMGKSVLAMNLATNAALHDGAKVLFLSLEMSALEISDRLLSSISGVPHYSMTRGTFNGDERERIVEASAALGSCNRLWLDDTAGRKVNEIAAICRRLKRKNDLGMLVIDYLQLLTPDNDRDNRQEQVAKMTRRLKTLARDLDIPIICLAQLNREAEKSGDNKPKLSHLRESGAIEQDADVVLLIYRADQYLPPSVVAEKRLEGVAEIIIAKQRNGRQGVAKLRWNAACMRFESEGMKAENWDPFAEGT